MKRYIRVSLLLGSIALANTGNGQEARPVGGKTFIDYVKPMPIVGGLSTTVWGASEVGARDPKNGLEDATMTKWNYWDGQILKGKDGKYHMFASRWPQAKGHMNWYDSKAVHAVSENLFGPYEDKGLLWPDNEEGKGHNVTALVLPDGRYAVVISETRPGNVFVSDSLDGPWTYHGQMEVADNEFKHLGVKKNGFMSNVSIIVRPDGNFQIVSRSGAILISKNGILGPYVVQGPSIYQVMPWRQPLIGLEDPVLWFSGGLYHIIVNKYNERRAYHLTSVDGIRDWKYRGVAYDATTDFARYSDGTVNHWHKLERPGVVIENGHVVALTLAVMDTPKNTQKGNNGHGSKVVVLPVDGAALDRDLVGK
ncbi:MAG: glycoside hydrolase family protein [Verrucomicrobia bacterium]|nr:glycoside hydrolase family protein [Verrucomicrobiota bacterium]